MKIIYLIIIYLYFGMLVKATYIFNETNIPSYITVSNYKIKSVDTNKMDLFKDYVEKSLSNSYYVFQYNNTHKMVFISESHRFEIKKKAGRFVTGWFLTNYDIQHSLVCQNEGYTSDLVFPLVSPKTINNENIVESSSYNSDTFKAFGSVGTSKIGIGLGYEHSWGQSFSRTVKMDKWSVISSMSNDETSLFSFYQSFPWAIKKGNGPHNFNDFASQSFDSQGKSTISEMSYTFHADVFVPFITNSQCVGVLNTVITPTMGLIMDKVLHLKSMTYTYQQTMAK
ncbi:expressed protein [Dictyostelium purpureum]|uniref:Expressed protein n=1 Tax=Dictyostelium purpureum TaxID=5786 RepID=F0ZXS4_DICPU|nr:uncharacterized protein DICPUDRAFT_92823 [Dictyostelium purpureum]EGC31264.1 expressed protein [Dictyostelium purpureum]|eukprot:XP_003292209.1 expressed protein [Dictyostelium purpureum]